MSFFKAEDAVILSYYKDENEEKGQKGWAEAGSIDSPMLNYNGSGNLSNICFRIGSVGVWDNYYPVCNSRGDVTELYNDSGAMVVKYTYDAWGYVTSIRDANGNDITDEFNIGNINPNRRQIEFNSAMESIQIPSQY